MNEECPNCGAKFSVTEIGGGGICGACREPIDCPYCHETVREERTTGTFTSTLIKIPDSHLSRYLGISDDDWEEMGAELNANTGNSGEMTYCYWFMVPEDTPEEILHKTGWKAGQTIDDIPLDVVDSEGDY
ncbi:hypothetical protein [Shewanella algae]|jgi:hypothetical protein|uniref:hypothetical protein n=1 Tax=Shewanella algae TaxID=38313 RepID=UPI0011829E25|nr:hypothetical protein [Shewanella algae]MBO2613094.1 hypothetical protein [Shewanella algae]MDO8255275.1 hypothetical protein [Shewanella algae]TVK90725.1 hypothetical protein AYI83_21310 [Shewanella algae]